MDAKKKIRIPALNKETLRRLDCDEAMDVVGGGNKQTKGQLPTCTRTNTCRKNCGAEVAPVHPITPGLLIAPGLKKKH